MSYQTPLYATLLGVATVASGIQLGYSSARWGESPSFAESEALLQNPLPEKAGNWRLRKEQSLEPEVLKMMQCRAYISRIYEHEQTGDLVTVAVLVGPPGPISVHTPEICYSARAYSVGKNRTRISVDDTQGNRHEFWDVILTANGSETYSQRVLYAWSTADSWSAADHPRFSYAGTGYLYKMQLACRHVGDVKRGDFDCCVDFLRSFLSQCQTRLREPGRSASDSKG